jgi:hypothetical protein
MNKIDSEQTFLKDLKNTENTVRYLLDTYYNDLWRDDTKEVIDDFVKNIIIA